MLYTRTGDDGMTKLFGSGVRVSKTSLVAEALGALDEVNSYLGLVRADLKRSGSMMVPVGARRVSAEVLLHSMQEVLFIVQAEVAGAHKHVEKRKVTALECITDSIEDAMPPLHTFSLAGGTYRSALFDVARTMVRKAERRVIAAHGDSVPKVGHTLPYLNRLSSALFALARYANHTESVQEEAPTYT